MQGRKSETPKDLARAKLWGNKTGYMSSKSLGKVREAISDLRLFQVFKVVSHLTYHAVMAAASKLKVVAAREAQGSVRKPTLARDATHPETEITFALCCKQQTSDHPDGF
ncbi:hypothetical protein CIHG_09573 [Coccidioides immitis H538.4]|uniref:Uncharacterized protein n=1 Tax=Coccidioides immitis H538.4 TaxID=396776 RepID=A0A0J8UVE5_COCIT|nr:hypothetical protein CIHG_09573 [Coccidioides immitis H538.4]